LDSINRRRFLGNASLLTAAALGAGAGPSNGNGESVDVWGEDPDALLATLVRPGVDSSLPGPGYEARLDRELAVIRGRAAARQFLAAAEVVRFARERGIVVGPGRGAAPASLVLHALGVTAVDPLAHGLVFERFLNAHLTAAPLICLDFAAGRFAEIEAFVEPRVAALGLELSGREELNVLRRAADDLLAIPLDDDQTFKRLSTGRSSELLDMDPGPLLGELRPECFEDVVAAVALCQPEARVAGLADLYVELKHSRCAVVPEHPALEAILEHTHGLILYQEQIMQIGSVIARQALDDGDLLRRALGRAWAEPVARQRQRFLRGALAAGVDWVDAGRIFTRMERSAPLAFNRAHAVACALIVYWEAYLTRPKTRARAALPTVPARS
jgi:DNA polymerase III alpha subunit